MDEGTDRKSKGYGIISRFSEDIDLALSREYFLKEKGLRCAKCESNTQLHNLREKGQDFLFGEFAEELKATLAEMALEFEVLMERMKELEGRFRAAGK